MTPEAQRIAIAKACKWAHDKDGYFAGWWRKWDGGDQRLRIDQLSDLNAMHEAEKMLTEKQELFYLIQLMKSMNESGTIGWRSERTYKATAAQRAEAFLRTLNLWKE